MMSTVQPGGKVLSPATLSGRPWRQASNPIIVRISSAAWLQSRNSSSSVDAERKASRSTRANVGGQGGGGAAPGSFLTMEEAGLVEMSSLDMHEKFLCRLTVSSLNLLRVIAEQEGVPVEELNAGRLCDWFQRDKAKREEDFESATLKWESSAW